MTDISKNNVFLILNREQKKKINRKTGLSFGNWH